MKEEIGSLRKIARIAGGLYLVTVFTTLYAHMYVPSKLYIREDAVATSRTILAHEALFRTCVAVGLLECIVSLVLALVLYRLFQHIDARLSKVLVGVAWLQAPVVFVLATCKISALMILKGAVPAIYSTGTLPAQAMLFLKFNEFGSMTMELLEGVWLLVLAILVYKCRFIPRVLGVLVGIAGAGYTGVGLTFLLLPGYPVALSKVAVLFWLMAELPIMLWFLFKGVKDYLSITVIAEALSTGSNSRTLRGSLK